MHAPFIPTALKTKSCLQDIALDGHRQSARPTASRLGLYLRKRFLDRKQFIVALYRPTSHAAIRTAMNAQTTAATISNVRKDRIGMILNTKARTDRWPRLRFL
jgi:hypothetical protein